MELTPVQQSIWSQVQEELADEPVATPDHCFRVARWAAMIGEELRADVTGLVTAGLLHDIGHVVDDSRHYLVGREKAEEILSDVGYPEDRRGAALHILESHSRYGGPDPLTTEAKIGKDADALELSGAIGIIRLIVGGIVDGSFSGRVEDLPGFLRGEIAKVEGTFITGPAERIGEARIEYMRKFLARVERELAFEV